MLLKGFETGQRFAASYLASFSNSHSPTLSTPMTYPYSIVSSSIAPLRSAPCCGSLQDSIACVPSAFVLSCSRSPRSSVVQHGAAGH